MALKDMMTSLQQANPMYSQIAAKLGISLEMLFALIIIVSVWSLVWKGLALWKSAKKNHMIWFVVLLIVNTVGILEILYIYVFSKIDLNKKSDNFKKKK